MLDRATKYAEEVASGKVIACKPHKLACERHLSELSKQKSRSFPFYWDAEASERVIGFANKLRLIEGFKEKPLTLYPSQCFDIGAIFGWKNQKGFRRFRRSYKSKARQNGKSLENGIISAYISCASGYRYGKLFTAATKKRQSRIAWEEIQKFILADKDLAELYRIKDYKSQIENIRTHCTIEALSKESGLDDGFRSICNSIDEIHQHRDNSIYQALYDGTRNLPETITSMITTRGTDMNSFCYEMDEYALNILHGNVTADDFFVDIYTLDEGDDYFDEKIWIKANPILLHTEHGYENMRRDAETAKDMGGGTLSNFLLKSCNLWTQDRQRQYIRKEDWKKCATECKLSDFKGKRAFVGLDLSSGGDLTSLALIIPIDSGEFYVYSHSFMPSARLHGHIKTDLAPYDIWLKEGLLTVTDTFSGIKNDYDFIIAHLRKLIDENELELCAIGYDPHNADGFLGRLESFGVPLVSITQSARFLNDTTVDFELMVRSGKIIYDKANELMNWSVVNAKKTQNSFGEIKVDKEIKARHKRIDVIDAILDAYCLIFKAPKNEINMNAIADEYFAMLEGKEKDEIR